MNKETYKERDYVLDRFILAGAAKQQDWKYTDEILYCILLLNLTFKGSIK